MPIRAEVITVQFVARAVQDWLAAVGAKTDYIAGQPVGERLYRELQRRDELLHGEIFYSLQEAQDRDRELTPPL